MTYDNFAKDAIKKYEVTKKDIAKLTIGVVIILLSVYSVIGYLAYRLISSYMLVAVVVLFLATFMLLFPYFIEEEKGFRLAVKLSRFSWAFPVLSIGLIVLFKILI